MMDIRAKNLETLSFGLNKEQAAKRTVYILLKAKRSDPHGMREYALVFTDRKSAEKIRDQFNNGQARYVYSVMETIISGPYS